MPDCNLANPALNWRVRRCCNAPLGSLNVAAHYSPEITNGIRRAPERSGSGASAASRRSGNGFAVDFQFTRHAFGNFVASQDTIAAAIGVRLFLRDAPTAAAAVSGYTLPNAGQQICGFMDLEPGVLDHGALLRRAEGQQLRRRERRVHRLRHQPERSAAARRHRLGRCQHRSRSDRHLRGGRPGKRDVRGGGRRARVESGTLAHDRRFDRLPPDTPSTLYCHVEPPFQPDIKGLVSYPLPWWGLTASATIQNRPGPQILATYTVTSALAQNLGRSLNAGSATTGLIAPGTLYGDRFTQLDVRFGKNFRLRQPARRRVDGRLQPAEQQRHPGSEQHGRSELADADADSAGTADEVRSAARFLELEASRRAAGYGL